MGGKLLKEGHCMIDICMQYVYLLLSILGSFCQERLFASNHFPLVYFKLNWFIHFVSIQMA